MDDTEAGDEEIPVTREALRQLEARIDARFQAVNARFIGVDGRFTELGQHIDEIEQLVRTMARYEERSRSIDKRLDATRTHVEQMGRHVGEQIAVGRRDLGRVVLFGLLGSVAITACLCLGTVALLL